MNGVFLRAILRKEDIRRDSRPEGVILPAGAKAREAGDQVCSPTYLPTLANYLMPRISRVMIYQVPTYLPIQTLHSIVSLNSRLFSFVYY